MENQISSVYEKIKQNIGKVIVGKDETIDMLIVTMLCGGHVLLEDVPGTGKTTMAKSLAKSLSCNFARVQFTPDLLPADITGLSCKEGEVDNAVFDKYRVPLYKEASFKPYIIAAMMFLARIKDPVAALEALENAEKPRKRF